jgi:hypothetical protein
MRSRLHDATLSSLATAVLLLAGFAHPPRNARQEVFEETRELEAKSRILPGVGAGVETLRRDSRGRYAVLAAPAQSISFYAADGKLLEEIPAGKAKHPLIASAADFDVDAQGSLYVADRGANAIKIFDAAGKLRQAIPLQAPASLAALSNGEIAAAGLGTKRLVEIFSAEGKLLREFGDLSSAAEHETLNRFLNLGHLATDNAGNVYYAFAYMPEPSVRRYDRNGAVAFDVSLKTLEFEPEALAMRREIAQQDDRGSDPSFKMIISAMGVDSRNQHVWLALGSELMELNQDGDRLATYRVFAPHGESLRPVSILPEPQRLLLADNQLGIYELSLPDQKPVEH